VPRLLDPQNRTTARPMYRTSNVQLLASPPRPMPVRNAAIVLTSADENDGWRPSHD
jgi:hypothetical protein